jgi:hypothetical protein
VRVESRDWFAVGGRPMDELRSNVQEFGRVGRSLLVTFSHFSFRLAEVLCRVVFTLSLMAGLANVEAANDAPETARYSWQGDIVVNPKLPPYIFAIESTGAGEVTIKITGGPKFYKGQRFTAPVEDEKRPDFGTCDVNFDGFTDFHLVESRGATANISYQYWVFDPKRMVFREAPEFDEINYIDEKKRLLACHSRGGNIEEITDYFCLRNGRPVKFRSVKITWAYEVRDIVPRRYSDNTAVRITRIYRRGKLHRTFFTADFDVE